MASFHCIALHSKGQGGVYRISENWYANHAGGPFASKNCGTVISGWFGKSGSHKGYEANLAAGEDLGANAVYVGSYVCPKAPPTTVTTVAAAVVTADFDVATICADTEQYKTIDQTGLTFCAKYVSLIMRFFDEAVL